MHRLKKTVLRRLTLVLSVPIVLTAGATACTYLFEDSMKSWVGLPISEFQEQYRNGSTLLRVETDKQTGQTVYAYSLSGLLIVAQIMQ